VRIAFFFLALLLMPLLGIGVFAMRHNVHHNDFKILAVLPPFTLTERSGSRIHLQDLKNKVWLANFIFTHCQGQCPTLTAKMKRIYREMSDLEKLRFVSFTVDPERDNPRVLSQYADRIGADPTRWLFLTGEQVGMAELIEGGFKLPQGQGGEEIQHSFKMALVDKWGRVRRYYDGENESELYSIRRDVERLLQETY